MTVCNSWNYFFTYLAEHFSEPDDTGPSQRALLNMVAGQQDDALGSIGRQRAGQRQGRAARQGDDAVPARRRLRRRRSRPTGSADCEAGQRGYIAGLQRRCATRASRATRTRAPSTARSRARQGPTYTRSTREGQGAA